MFDMISVGDCTLDSLIMIHDAEVNCTLHTDRCMFCVNFGDKIPVDKLHRKVAGNAANNAVGETRLGLRTAFYTILGNDGTGEFIQKTLKKEKVNLDYVSLDHRKETNSSFVLNFKGERTIFVYHAPRIYNLPKLAKSEWMYYTSLGPNHSKLNKQIVTYIKKNGVKLAYNPGTYQLQGGYKKMAEVLKVTYIIFINKEEAARIVGPQHDIRHYLLAVHKTGPKIVVITDGPNGSFVFDGEKFWQMGILKTPIIERTGAGDAFASGFIAGLHKYKSIPKAICWGTCNSASVIMKYGPQDGLMTEAQMNAFHKKYKCAHPTNF